MTITDGAFTRMHPDPGPAADDLAAFGTRGRGVRVTVQRADETPVWLPYVMRRLEQLLDLAYEPEDEMPSPHPEAVQRALPELGRIMRADTPTPSVVPTIDGGVLFVWHKGGWDVEVEVGPKETELWAHRRDGSASWQGSLDERVDDVRRLLVAIADPA